MALLLGAACGPDRTWLGARDAGQPADAAASDAGIEPLPVSGLDPLLDWPLIPIGVESRQFSSFDRGGGNDDGFTGKYSALYRDAGEYVIFDALGPGRLNTLWFTSGIGSVALLNQGQIRFYFDDEPTPRVDVDSDLLFSGEVPGFPAELVFGNRESSGGYVSYVPLPFARRLKITLATRPFFYNAQYDTFPVDLPLRSWNSSDAPAPLQQRFAAVLGENPALLAAAGAAPETPAPPGAEPSPEQLVPLDFSHSGAGTLESLRIRLDPDSVSKLHDARIQITWDDQATPAVDCPLDMFFGSGLGLAPVRALGFSMDVGEQILTQRFPMPFWRGFHLLLSGISGEVRLRVGPERHPARQAGYFHALYARQNPPTRGQDFAYLERSGAGKLVGTVLTVVPPDPAADKRWWEGDLRSYANGRRSPSIHGTGHEDDHLGGWSNGFFERPFTLPMNGEPAAQILDFDGQYNGNISMYRLWSGIPFLSEIRHGVEHGRQNESAAEYSATTFFYAQDSAWLQESDQLSACDAASREAHRFGAEGEGEPTPLDSSFEGRAYRTRFSDCSRSHTGVAEFELEISPANQGVYLRRVYDQGVGRQRAQIAVDGEAVGEWYAPEENSASRWAERDFFLPARLTQGKRRLALRVSPVADSPPWFATEYRALVVNQP